MAINPIKLKLAARAVIATEIRMRIHEGEIGLTRMAGHFMKPLAYTPGYKFSVFHEDGSVLYYGMDMTVARLVASCYGVPVY